MKPIKFIFFVMPQTHLLDLSGPDQVFFEAKEYGANLTIEYCSFINKTGTSAGLPFGKLKHFSKVKIQKGDYLVIPGADREYLLSKEVSSQKVMLNWIKKSHENGVNILSICSGSFLLAQTGLLDGKKCTTHWKRVGELQRLFPKLLVQENVLFTEDNGIYTSAGIVSGIDLALYIIEKIMGEYFSYKVARELVMYKRRDGQQSQKGIYTDYRNHIHTGIHKVQDFIIENVGHKSSLEALAELANMSSRNFTRVFKKETNLTVNEFITLVRVEKIRDLMKNPDISRAQIAKQCGLQSERQISRLLKLT